MIMKIEFDLGFENPTWFMFTQEQWKFIILHFIND